MQNLLLSPRRSVAWATSVAVALGMGLLVAPNASAADLLPGPAPVEQRPSTAVTADELPTVQIDKGVVWSQAVVGNTVFAGGNFSNTRPPGAAAGKNLTPRSNLLAYDIRTGDLLPFDHKVNGQVKVVRANPDGTRLYIGGTFTAVDGKPRGNIAAFDVATGALIDEFSPVISGGYVNALAPTDTSLYVGGDISSVNGVKRSNLAALTPSGVLSAWAPTTDNQVDSMVLTPGGAKVIVGGRFGTVNGSRRVGMASLDASTGASGTWLISDPNKPVKEVVRNGGASNGGIWDLSTDGTNIYGAAWAYAQNAGTLEGIFAASPADGAVVWLGNGEGDQYAVYSDGTTVYGAGHYHMLNMIGGFYNYDTPGGQHQNSTAFTAAAKGRSTAGGYWDHTGMPAPAIVHWYPRWVTGTFTGMGQAGWSIAGNSEYVSYGGEFQGVNGSAQMGLTRFARSAIAPNLSGPRESGSAWGTPTAVASPGGARVTIRSTFDRDDRDLTYELYRSGTAAPVASTVFGADLWNRQNVTLTDTSAEPGGRYTYQVKAVDSGGNSALSNTVTVTASTTPVPAYAKNVLADGASLYWRLGGSNLGQDWAGSNDGTVTGGVTSAPTGAIAGAAASVGTGSTFNGSNGSIGTKVTTVTSTTGTTELWFRSSSNSGGELIGYGSASSGASTNTYRTVYMRNDGKLTFGLNTGGVKSVATTRMAYNNGKWHHLAVTVGAKGMLVYVDGGLVGSNQGVTAAGTDPGYWRVGGDSLAGWPDRPATDYFGGDLDEFAVYGKALTKGVITAHYTTGRGEDEGQGGDGGNEGGGDNGGDDDGNAVATPADAYGSAVYASDPDFYWRFDDAANSTSVADASANLSAGRVITAPTFGAEGVIAGNAGAKFGPSTGTVIEQRVVTNPNNVTISTWFKTTTTRGGRLIGFGATSNGFSSSYDRMIYMRNDGKLDFGIWSGSARLVTSPKALNDGQWHQATGTIGADGLKLYVDGQLVGTNAAYTAGSNITGYWKVGGDWTWNSSSYYLDGILDEATVYSRTMPAAQIAELYGVAKGEIVPPMAKIEQTSAKSTFTFDGSGSTVAAGRTITSYAWDFGDGNTGTGVKPTHTYTKPGTFTVTLTVTDSNGTVGKKSTLAKYDYYASAVQSANPDFYWRFNDSPGAAVAADSSGNGSVGKLTSAPTFGAQGVIAGNAGAKFGPSSGAVTEQRAVSNPNQFTTSAWFKTTTTRGGRIIGFGTGANGNSGSYDRMIYMRNDGKLDFGIWSGSARLVTSPTALNDGQWHQVTGTLGADGLKLYVDGKLVASNAAYTAGSNITGYWKVGGDWTWNSSSQYLDGIIDEAAVYSRTMAADEVANLFSVANGEVPPSATFTSMVDGYVVNFDATGSGAAEGKTTTGLAWDFGDGTTGTGLTPTHTYTKPGVYTASLRVTDNGGLATQTSDKVSLDYYAPAVVGGDPDFYWRFEDSPGAASAVDSSSSNSAGRIVAAPAFGADGVFAGTSAARFNGSTGIITEQRAVANPNTFTTSAWFKTTSTRGGRIIGLGAGATGLSGSYDRMVYLRNDGKLDYGVNVGGTKKILSSPTALNDGKWHQVTATLSSDGQMLYIDGQLVGSNTAVTSGEKYTGYWRVGGDWTWSSSSQYLDGVIDEAAVYSRALSASEVSGLFAVANGATLPTPKFTAVMAGHTVTVDATGSTAADGKTIKSYAWDFGDGTTATGAKATRAFTEIGDFPVTLRITDSAGLSATSMKVVTVEGNHLAPKAVATATPQGLTVAFDASASTIDDEAVSATYAWDFGDGTTGTGAKVSHKYAAEGSYTATVTVTDNFGGSDKATVSVALGSKIALDTFSRTNAAGWGDAETGGAWKTDSGLSAANGQGVMTLASQGLTRNAMLTGAAAADSDTVFDIALGTPAAGGSTMVNYLVRSDSTGSYRVKVVYGPNGATSASLVKVIDGNEQFLKSANLPAGTYTPGEVVRVRFQAVGSGTTELKAKFWQVGTTEPAAWLLTTADAEPSLQDAGQLGFSVYLSGSATNVPQQVMFDNLSVVEP